MKSIFRIIAFAALFTLPVLAHAHPGHDGHDLIWSFGTGFGHPFSGWDHFLAMIAVGLWASLLGGRARWLVPAAFVGMMAVGAVGGHDGLALPGIEQGIAASLLAMGLLITFTVNLPTASGMALVGIFALFHGWAHGAEIPALSSGFSYGAGFVAATVLLHAAGLTAGLLMPRTVSINRFAGGTIAIAGLIAFLT